MDIAGCRESEVLQKDVYCFWTLALIFYLKVAVQLSLPHFHCQGLAAILRSPIQLWVCRVLCAAKCGLVKFVWSGRFPWYLQETGDDIWHKGKSEELGSMSRSEAWNVIPPNQDAWQQSAVTTSPCLRARRHGLAALHSTVCRYGMWCVDTIIADPQPLGRVCGVHSTDLVIWRSTEPWVQWRH